MGPFGGDDLDRRRDLVRSTTPTRVGSVAPDSGVVAVEGVVRVHEATVSPPLADATVVDPDADEPDGTTPRLDADTGTTDRDGDGGTSTLDPGPGPDADVVTGTGTDTGTTATVEADAPDAGPSGPAGSTTLDALAADGESERGPAVLATHARRPRDGSDAGGTTVEAVPFVVEDETGRLVVDPSDLRADDVLLSAGTAERFLGDEAGTRLVRATGGDPTREVARARTAGVEPDWIHERGTLRAGDRVYVLGRPRPREGEPRTALGRGDDPRAFVVSDLSRSALAEQLARAGGGLDRRFWLFAVLGAIVVAMVLITVAVFVDSFLL